MSTAEGGNKWEVPVDPGISRVVHCSYKAAIWSVPSVSWRDRDCWLVCITKTGSSTIDLRGTGLPNTTTVDLRGTGLPDTTTVEPSLDWQQPLATLLEVVATVASTLQSKQRKEV